MKQPNRPYWKFILGFIVFLPLSCNSNNRHVYTKPDYLNLPDRFKQYSHAAPPKLTKFVSVDDSVKWVREYNHGSLMREYYTINDRYEGTMTIYSENKIEYKLMYLDSIPWLVEYYYWTSNRLDSTSSYYINPNPDKDTIVFETYGKKVFDENGNIDAQKSRCFTAIPRSLIVVSEEYNPVLFSFYSKHSELMIQMAFNNKLEEPFWVNEKKRKTMMIYTGYEGLNWYSGVVKFCDKIPNDSTGYECLPRVFVIPVYAIPRDEFMFGTPDS